jgi:hypothetical protein
MSETLEQLKNLPSDYADKVYTFLKNGKQGASYNMTTLCIAENQPTFIALVKEYMVMTPWQGGWEFLDDYKKLRRLNIF